MLIDSHCHLHDPLFDPDRDKVLDRAKKAGVGTLILPAATQNEWPLIQALCEQHPGLYPAFGIHPIFCEQHQNKAVDRLAQWIEQTQPSAIGECGLDRQSKKQGLSQQELFFRQQLALAQEHALPVIIHARNCVEEAIQIVRNYPKVCGVFHCFSGSYEQAKQLIDLGFCLGFGGAVTYPKATRLRRVIQQLPIESLLLESDAPDQPDAHFQASRNEPSRLPCILKEIATLRGESIDSVAAVTTRNTQTLFSIPA